MAADKGVCGHCGILSAGPALVCVGGVDQKSARESGRSLSETVHSIDIDDAFRNGDWGPAYVAQDDAKGEDCDFSPGRGMGKGVD